MISIRQRRVGIKLLMVMLKSNNGGFEMDQGNHYKRIGATLIVVLLAIGSLLIIDFDADASNDITRSGNEVGIWHFDEGLGQIALDSSGNGNDGQLGVTDETDDEDPIWVNGISGNGLEFDGDNDHLIIEDSSDDLDFSDSSFSWEFWINRNELGNHIIISQGTPQNNRGLHITFNSDNIFKFGFWYNDLDTKVLFSETSKWFYFAGSFDSNTKERKIFRF